MGKIWDESIGAITDAVLWARMQVQGAAPVASPAFTGTPTSPAYSVIGANGQSLAVKVLEELTTIAAAATSSSTIQIPAGALVLAVSVRVTTVIPTATTMTVGDGSTAAKFNTGSNIAVAAGTTDVGTKAGPTYYASATSIVFTPSQTPATATGRVRTTIFYIQVTPPTA